jgi:hypothetical protein
MWVGVSIFVGTITLDELLQNLLKYTKIKQYVNFSICVYVRVVKSELI